MLGLLQALGGRVPRLDFQKYLFLLSKLQKTPSFDFVPYKFGGFSFQSYADRRALEEATLLEDMEDWCLVSSNDYLSDLSPSDQEAIKQLVHQFSSLKGQDLLRYVYREYPYFAINSEVAAEVLSQSELAKVKRCKPAATQNGLFSIGYEGKSIDAYLDLLIQNNIKALCDVRKNPLSRKYGFSKRQLESCLTNLGIAYYCFPSLGIESSERRELESFEDYQRLFDRYEANTLPKQKEAINDLIKVFRDHGRVAFTCFEADHRWCHRSRVAKALEKHPGYHQPVVHL